MELIIITGVSGAGKSCAIKALEDCGYYPLDHLPLPALAPAVKALSERGITKVAAGLDPWEPGLCESALALGARLIALDADEPSLLSRYAQTRRKHPLESSELSLSAAIATEKRALTEVARWAHRIDTSGMSANTLKALVKEHLELSTQSLQVVVQSFGFKHGAPVDADMVLDARCLPNPYYDTLLRPLTGLDAPVKAFFSNKPAADRMARDIARFIIEWHPDYARDHRSSLRVAVGCTGGQHRSVHVAEAACALVRAAGIGAQCAHRERARWPVAAPEAQAGAPAGAPPSTPRRGAP